MGRLQGVERCGALTSPGPPGTLAALMHAHMDRGRRAPFGLALALLLSGYAVLLVGCYASHGLGDAGPRVDAPVRDAPLRDSPVRDSPPDAPIRRPDAPPVRCARDADCAMSLCVLDTETRAVDGLAVPLTCGVAGSIAPGRECDSNAACENGLCALAGGCVEPCITATDCRPDERCTEVPIVTGRAAMQPAMACARWVDAPTSVTVTENVSLPVAPFSPELFSIPAGVGSHRLVLHVADQYAMFRSIDRVALSGPAGATLFDISTFGALPQINPALAYFDLAPILVPNAPWPSGPDVRGALSYAITTSGESTLQRIVLDHAGTGTTLDLNVFFVGAARSASSRRTVDDMLERYGDILATFGARVGRVRQFEVVGSAVSRFEVLDDEMEAGELFRMSAGAARPAVNLFLVSSSLQFLGLAGGIPGAQAMHGTRASGLMLAWDDLESVVGALGIDFLAMVLAHEVGHFAGLFHTTELDGSSFEPLADTASCDIARDTNADGMLDGDECFDFDGQNIMFWAASFPDSTFSTSQRDVMRAAPVLLP